MLGVKEIGDANSATLYAGNCSIGARSNFAEQRIKVRNLDIEFAITTSFLIGHQLTRRNYY